LQFRLHLPGRNCDAGVTRAQLGTMRSRSRAEYGPGAGAARSAYDIGLATDTEWIAGNWYGTSFQDLPVSGETNSWPVVVPA